jgi:outer membrane protein assembly factor BamB
MVRCLLGYGPIAAIALIAAAPTLIQAERPRVPDLRTRKTGSDWPGFLGPSRNGRSPEKPILTDWPADGPRVRWSRPVGEGYSMPAVSRGRLFLFDRHGDRARLTCMKSETGEELWRAEYPTRYQDYYDFSNGPRATPVADHDRVYVFGAEGMLRCHRTTDGRLLWSIDTAKQFGVVQNFFGVGSTPIIEGDLLLVQIGGSPADSPKIHSGRVRGNGSGIVAFDKYSGEVRYRITDELASYSSPTVVTMDGRRWGFVFTRGGLVGFEPASGQVDFFYPWRARELESVNASNPVVHGDTVLISESYGPGSSLLRVRPGGYDVIWKDPPERNKTLQTHWGTPIYHRGYVYGCHGSGSSDAELRAIEYMTGKVMWRQPGLGRTTLLYANGHLIVQSEDGKLSLVEATPARYRLVAQTKGPLVERPAWNAPILSHGLLYVQGRDRLLCMELIPEALGR